MPTRREGRRRFYRVKGGRRRRRRLTGWVLGAMTAAIAVWVLIFGETGWRRVSAEEEAVEKLRARSQELRAQTRELENRIERIREPGSLELEKTARERYLMRGVGEEVFHVLEPDSGGTASETPAPTR